MGSKAPSLGDLLIRDKLITPPQLEQALAEQKRTRERLGEIFCRLGYLSEEQLLNALSRQLGHRLYDPAKDAVDLALLEIIPLEFARRHGVLPIARNGVSLTVAMNDPQDVEAKDQLGRIISDAGLQELEIVIAPKGVLETARETNYERLQGGRGVDEAIGRVSDQFKDLLIADEELDQAEAQRRAEEAGVIDLVDRIIAQALQERATDIHIEMHETGFVIRYRVDGLLYDAHKPPRSVYTGTVSRVKIMSNMDIAERRAAQDGRFSYKKDGREVDVRVSCIPTIHGEKLVLRLLDKGNFNFSLRDLGFSEEDYRILLHAIHQPYGMVLLSGPTGSGKSTTLYASLLELKNETVNITTVEDPVEYQVAGINQVQVNERKKMTFPTALRYFLRQDPDVIMVGEIRDQETAEIAIRAALTGHLVFSTIHANDAPSTATRLLSMGVESFMAASALTLVAAQRLVRRNCRFCLTEYTPADDVMVAFHEILAGKVGGTSAAAADSGVGGVAGRSDRGAGSAHAAGLESVPGQKPRFLKGAGCAACRGRGYKGRIAIIERMVLTPTLRQMIAENRPASEIRALAIREGMETLRESGLKKALEGMTTAEEILRVCLSDDQ